MSTNVYYDPDNLQKTLDSMCKCGHKLSYHGFVDALVNESSPHLRVSQCVFCGYNKDKDEFLCKEFDPI